MNFLYVVRFVLLVLLLRIFTSIFSKDIGISVFIRVIQTSSDELGVPSSSKFTEEFEDWCSLNSW